MPSENTSNTKQLFIFADKKQDNHLEPKNHGRWKVMIVDDEDGVHVITKLILKDCIFEEKGIEFISAFSGEEALIKIQEHPDTSLILMDVVMETENTGLDVVKYIRDELKNHQTRIVLRTGQPGEIPEEDIVLQYDVNDYKEKTELTTQKLFTTVIAALRNYRDIILIEEQRKEQSKILQKLQKEIKEREKIEADLILSKEKAEEMNRLKDNFLSNMNHELRTPINGILGFSDLIYEMVEEQDIRTYASMIKGSGIRLINTLDAIFDLTALETKKNLELSPLNLVQASRSAIQLQKIYAEEKQLEYVVNYQSSELRSLLHGPSIEKILNHVIGNAVKFSKKGNVEISFFSKKLDQKDWVFVEVKDTGVGIAEEFLPFIFEKFKQESDGYARVFEGTGIGLAIAKKLVTMMNGKFFVESTKGKGSTFTIAFLLH
ncbi:MAG: signal transduction histidine kinase [bacterium]|jgi:signal transduction histidine kinase